ncbi:OmpA family protein [Mariprofundus ferrooxydans]|nr:OmpA family protein [Mariprofundus ferrooxydans]
MLKYLFLSFSLLISTHALAENSLAEGALSKNTIESLQQQLNHFKKSSDAIYAETTLTRVEAYLGAAMLAKEDEKQEATQAALRKAQSTLQEAKANAKHFQEKFKDLLSLQQATQEVIKKLPHDNNPLKDPNPNLLLQDAKQSLKEVIRAAEAGKLNISQQAASAARTAFRQALDAALPTLIGATGSVLSRASSKNAKYYAPSTYEKAKQAFSILKLYRDGINNQLPKHPAKALELAELALEISSDVKIWRRNKASHEMLWLQARKQRQDIAASLKLALHHDDISLNELVRAIEQLQARLQQTKIAFQQKLSQLKSNDEANLARALEQQRSSLTNEHDNQLSNMKEAFRAKLERETFETKRQKRIQALFPKHGVNIIANLDGSLVLRLSSLKFSPGSSKIDAAYFDLLSRVKDVLDIYGDRNFRIEGHTDDQGELKANQRLSLKRAESVRDFLAAAGADASAMKALGYGEVRPIASNDFTKGREMNRRIDLVIEARNDR